MAEGCLSVLFLLIPDFGRTGSLSGWGTGCVGEEDSGNCLPRGVLWPLERGFRGGDVEGREGHHRGHRVPTLSRIEVRCRCGAVPARAAGRVHVCCCVAGCVSLWEVRAERGGCLVAGSLWAPVSGWPGVSGCACWGVAEPCKQERTVWRR